MIELNVFKQRLGEKEDAFPLLTLDEFFNGNLEEDSIAPNQWGYGRPPLAELWGALRRVAGMPEVESTSRCIATPQSPRRGEQRCCTLWGIPLWYARQWRPMSWRLP